MARRPWWFRVDTRGHSNCLFVTIGLILWKGGYGTFRRTRPPIGVGLHWIWHAPASMRPASNPARRINYEPINRKRTTFQAAIHKVWYAGRWRRYDNHWTQDFQPRRSPH